MRFVLLVATLFSSSSIAALAEDRPNVLVIVSEDNGPELGCYGTPAVSTPHLDKLAADGVRFDRAYVPQAGCSQSRAAYLTGLYPHVNGQIGLATWRFRMYRPDTPNLVTWLQAAGYRTGIIGKLHVNPESAFPFDFHEIPSANFSRKMMGDYAKFAGEFINKNDQPFFLSVNYPDAHRPHIKQVDGLPADPLEPEDVEVLDFIGIDSPTLRADTANHLNCMSRLDSLVGDLLQVLSDSGKAENTVVIYFGDHGADLIRGKRTCYEGGVRVPLIIRWPTGIESGQVRSELVSTLDLAPTILEATSADAVTGLSGRSLLPLLTGQEDGWREYLFTEYHTHSAHNYFPQRAVCTQRFKLIQSLQPNKENPDYRFTIERWYTHEEIDAATERAGGHLPKAYKQMRRPPEFQLYDLEADPYEFHNLADDSRYADTLNELREQLAEWREQTNDPFLDPDCVRRLKDEIASTHDGKQYNKIDEWAWYKSVEGVVKAGRQ